MTIVGGLDVHRQQITFDYVDNDGSVHWGQIRPATRKTLRHWLGEHRHAGDEYRYPGCIQCRVEARAVVQNRARPGLLDTYHAERALVVSRLVKGTRTFTRLVLLGDPVATAARRGIASRVMSPTGPENTLAQALSEIDISYRRRSRIHTRGRLAIGDRAPNARVINCSTGALVTLFDVLDDERHTLMIVGPAQRHITAAAADHPDDVRVRRVVHDDELGPADSDSVFLDADGQVSARYHMPSGGYALIRPDGYIAALELPQRAST